MPTNLDDTTIEQKEAKLKKLQKELEELRAITPAYFQKRLRHEEACGEYTLDNYSEKISETFALNPSCDFILVRVFPGFQNENLDFIKLQFCGLTTEEIPKINARSLRQEGVRYFDQEDILTQYIRNAKNSCLTVVVRWEYSEEYVKEYYGEDIVCQPIQYFKTIPRPYLPPKPFVNRPTKIAKPKARVNPEKQLEQELLSWIRSRGFDAENQVKTFKHRMDLWIPGRCFLELKKGKVSGDDVCQAMDYCAEYKKPVIIVGDHIGEMASRGIKAFNKAVDADMLVFVQWSAVKTYLKGLFSDWR